jgi:hypothetical protein
MSPKFKSPIKRYDKGENKMRTIWKFSIKTMDEQTVQMPEGARVISVGAQNEIPCIWAMVETDNKPVARKFSTYGTGHEIREDFPIYAGTYMLHGGSLVFHVYETF